MKQLCFLAFMLGGFTLPLSAAHIRGGELFYKYLGVGNSPNTSSYRLTLKLYIDCGQNNPGQLDEQVYLTAFSNRGQVGLYLAYRTKEEIISYDPASNPCITNPPSDVCYRLRYYEVTVQLPNIADGYLISFQRCCRIAGIQNMYPPSNDVGATYSCEIPGTRLLSSAVANSSPLFKTSDAVAVCVSSSFEFDFSAADPDNSDSLVYQLCNAYEGGGPSRGQNCSSCPTPIPASAPPYRSLAYQPPYSGTSPMGANVSINSKTGMLSGIAPRSIGQYVVTVCIAEYRQGILINTHRKDIHIKVSDCRPLKAVLKPDYAFCDDFLVTFRNQQINPTGSVYTWDFGDGSASENSNIPDGTITHQYAAAGTYMVKVKVVLAGKCIDSTSTKANVYPGFYPGFTFSGACLFVPFRFTDTTKTRYGVVSNWAWRFGDETTDADTSNVKNPTWLYNSTGTKEVQLIVSSDKGCTDTVPLSVLVTEKPPIFLPFKDTLICSIDSLEINAAGNGIFEWTPDYNIINPNTNNPIVYPKRTTTYNVKLTQDLCVSTDAVRVRVVDFVTLSAGADSTICLTDTAQLFPASDGLQYTWTASPLAYFLDNQVKNPFTVPGPGTTNYHVIARIGKCVAEDDISIKTVPYPLVDAGGSQTICYDDTVRLNGYTDGSSYRWDPNISIIGGNTRTPLVFPLETRSYTLLGFDTLGCPKPGFDKVLITVRPQIHAFAGNDTAIVRGQPLQLKGSGAELFAWSPESGLNRNSGNDPVAVLDQSAAYIMTAYTPEGCFSMDTINIQVFKTMPDIFVPNAFVPTGKNNNMMPKAVGISKLDYFRIYNRWGQMVFQTSEFGKGWNGRINGTIQKSDTYVWMVSGTDYTGRKVIKKGTSVLIR